MKRALVFGGEENPYHDFAVSGPVLARLAREAGYDAELTRDAAALLPGRIAPYQLVVVSASSGTLNAEQESGLLAAVIGQPGGETGPAKGLLGVHGATVLDSASGRYQRMIGARFLTHPPMGQHRLAVQRPGHPVMDGVHDFSLVDELYLMESLSPFEVLLSAEHEGWERPIAWVRPFGLGRVVYCALGHGTEQLEHPSVSRILRNAMAWLGA